MANTLRSEGTSLHPEADPGLTLERQDLPQEELLDDPQQGRVGAFATRLHAHASDTGVGPVVVGPPHAPASSAAVMTCFTAW